MLKTARSTLRRIACPSSDAIGTERFGSPSVTGETGSRRSTIAAPTAITRLLAGPAAATSMKSRLGCPSCRGLTGTGFAQPMSGTPLIIAISGKITVPIRSAWTIGFSETRPSRRAVGSPSWSAVHACAISWTVSENSRTTNPKNICAKSMCGKEQRLRPAREKRKDGIRGFRSDDRGQLFTRRSANAGERAERGQQRLAPARSDARDVVELRSQVAHRARAAMEREGKAMGFVADSLNEQQLWLGRRERNRIVAIAREQELLFLRDADRDEVREPELLERRVRRRQLPLAAVDQHEIGKRSTELEQLAVSSQDDFVHGFKVVISYFGRGPTPGRRRARAVALAPIWNRTSQRNLVAACRRARAVALAPIWNRTSHPSDSILAIVAAPHTAVLAHHHRRNGPAALTGGDVEAFDAARKRGQRQDVLQRFQCIVLSGTRLVEPRLIRERRVPIPDIDETALLAALRHEDLHTASCARRQVLFDGLAFVGLRRRVNFRWRAAQLVELLDRRGQHFAVARGGNRPAEAFPLLLCPQLDALDDAPAAHLKDLHGDPRGPALQAEDVAVSELGGRHLLLPIVERLHGAHRVAQLRRFFVPFTVGRGDHPRPQRLHELFVLAFEEQLRHVDRARVLVP